MFLRKSNKYKATSLYFIQVAPCYSLFAIRINFIYLIFCRAHLRQLWWLIQQYCRGSLHRSLQYYEIRFYIWYKYYVGVISHCHHHKEKCRPRKPKSNAYSSLSRNHFIAFSHMELFTFFIGCKYHVGVISHCRHHEEKCRPLLGNPKALLIVICMPWHNNMRTSTKSESEDRTEGGHQPNLDSSFVLPYAFCCMPHAAVGL